MYDLQCTGLAVDLIPIEIGCLGHFMPETIIQVATACSKLYSHCLSKLLALPSLAPTEFSILELP